MLAQTVQGKASKLKLVSGFKGSQSLRIQHRHLVY